MREWLKVKLTNTAVAFKIYLQIIIYSSLKDAEVNFPLVQNELKLLTMLLDNNKNLYISGTSAHKAL